MARATRERVKEIFPTVALTLLSIVQAIALELLWNHISESSHLYQSSLQGVIGWVQVAATLLGLVLIWIIYASNFMRFRWVPSMSDSIYPFAVGILQFWMIEVMGPGQVGTWLVCVACIITLMTWVSQATLVKARRDSDNAEFFGRVRPATYRDFVPQTGVVLALLACALYVGYNRDFALIACGLVCLFMVWQLRNATGFWANALGESNAQSTEPAEGSRR